MSISIGGTVVIDDGRNIVNANDIRVGLVTITGSTGDIVTPGKISAQNFDFPVNAISFSPALGATNVNVKTDIFISFNQPISKATSGVGTTANITFRSGSATGTVLNTIAISSTSVSVRTAVVIITIPFINLKGNTNIFVVIDSGAFVNSLGTSSSPLIDTYNFTTELQNLGDSFEGGFMICKATPLTWVVSSPSMEISRNWYCKDDAVTVAQQVSGCTGWFVPTRIQLQNPGYICRSFWGPSPCFSLSSYMTSTESTSNSPLGRRICLVDFVNGGGVESHRRDCPSCVRAFRCVTY
jgi:hypothetical protein